MTPIVYTWDGDGMIPLARFRKAADKQFVVGETYTLAPHEERSMASHRQYFAELHNLWLNLPEDIAERFPTSEHIRKYALVKAGYADERSIVCASKAEALRVAAFVKPMDEFAIVVTRDATIKVYTAQSQSTKAMDRKRFQKSKQDVLDIVSAMVGVPSPSLAPAEPHRERVPA